ncbi:hypothetical protein GUJ93_ZPchr0005g14377 [Zizania palustris]|uniref:Uncharacterized protein n=1 Tax=Zizania palustris TaxID=103762 RepID=A0A8J5SN20_ZIZPA|nr:hypothetical protein GUJ93_ZPchr0005g14377 [Zizania palustris]
MLKDVSQLYNKITDKHYNFTELADTNRALASLCSTHDLMVQNLDKLRVVCGHLRTVKRERSTGGINKLLYILPVYLHKLDQYTVSNDQPFGLSSVLEADTKKIVIIVNDTFEKEGLTLVVACGRDTISYASSIKSLAPDNVFVIQGYVQCVGKQVLDVKLYKQSNVTFNLIRRATDKAPINQCRKKFKQPIHQTKLRNGCL